MGAIVYDVPLTKFTPVRGYCKYIYLSSDFLTEPAWDGQTIVWDSLAGYTYRLRVSDEFYDFSTVAYSLDRVMDTSGSSIDCHLFPCFDQVNIRWKLVLNDYPAGIELQPLATLTSKRALLLPPPPPDYWALPIT